MANEIKQLRFGSFTSPEIPEAGTFTLTFGGDTTDEVNWNVASFPGDLEDALAALPSIGGGNVTVSPDGEGGLLIEFINDLGDQDVGDVTATSGLSADASTVTVTETQAGDTGVSTQVFTVELPDNPTEGQFILSEVLLGETDSIVHNADAATVEAALDALAGYSVTGPAHSWTCESDAQEDYDWSGAENPGAPLRRSIDIEIQTVQEGGADDVEGDGAVAFSAALAGSGTIDSTGSGGVSFAVSALAGTGTVPFSGSGSVTFAASSLAGTGTMMLQAMGSVEFAAAGLNGVAELADTARGFKHWEEISDVNDFLELR